MFSSLKPCITYYTHVRVKQKLRKSLDKYFDNFFNNAFYCYNKDIPK